MPGQSSSRDDDLIGLIYAAAAERALWPKLLHEMETRFSGHTAIYERLDSAPETHQLLVTDLDPDFVGKYNAHYNARNRWATSPLNQAGSIVVSEQIIGACELERTDFYGEWLRPQKLKHAVTAPLMRKSARSLNLGLVRDHRRGEYTPEELKALQRLLPHFQRAMEIAERLEAASLTQKVSLEALSASAICMILADREGRVVFASAAAEQLLGGDGPFALGSGRLHAARRRDDSRFRSALRDAAGPGGSARGDLLMLRCNEDRGYTVMVAPAPEGGLGLFCRDGLALVLVAPLDGDLPLRPEALTRLFDLSGAEARLAAAICSGTTVADYSAEAGIGVTTAKTHLKGIFGKVGVNRQSDLVRVIAGSTLLTGQAFRN